MPVKDTGHYCDRSGRRLARKRRYTSTAKEGYAQASVDAKSTRLPMKARVGEVGSWNIR